MSKIWNYSASKYEKISNYQTQLYSGKFQPKEARDNLTHEGAFKLYGRRVAYFSSLYYAYGNPIISAFLSKVSLYISSRFAILYRRFGLFWCLLRNIALVSSHGNPCTPIRSTSLLDLSTLRSHFLLLNLCCLSFCLSNFHSVFFLSN